MKGLGLVFVLACGGGSGGGAPIRGEVLLVELTANQRDELCDEMVELRGEPHHVQCTPESSWETGMISHEICLDILMGYTECTATVRDFQLCNRGVAMMTDEQICADDFPSACDLLTDCVF